jgi:Flp pilus assembly protein TadG
MPGPGPRHRGYRPRFRDGGRRRGQSLVELALVAPILVAMLLGAAQVGSIAFGLVSIDTAAREGARAGAIAPNKSLIDYSTNTTWYTSSTTTHQCNTADFGPVPGGPPPGTPGNPICEAVLNSSGTLNQSLFTVNPCASAQQACVTISVKPIADLLSMQVVPHAARLESASCLGSNATVTGVVSGMPSGQTATVTATTGETQPTDTSGNFSICVLANSLTTSQTLTAQVGPPSCGGWSGSVGPFSVSSGATLTENITVSAEGPCPPPPPTPTPTPVTCDPTQETVTGVVSGMPSGQVATITATTGETALTGSLGVFKICVTADDGITSQTLTAQVGSPVCDGYTGSVGPFAVTKGGVTIENITVTVESACSAATPAPAPPVNCPIETVPDTYYIQVTVTYPSPIFVPFIGAIFQSQPGFRVISATVTDSIEPCSLTLGN